MVKNCRLDEKTIIELMNKIKCPKIAGMGDIQVKKESLFWLLWQFKIIIIPKNKQESAIRRYANMHITKFKTETKFG